MVQIKTLENGIKIVAQKMNSVRSVALGIWVKNGSKNETNTLNGISHFIEHMLFKGTANRNASDIACEIDAIGGQLNAYTSKDYTCYYTKTLDIHIDIALQILSDMILNSLFDEEDIKKEFNVILEEIDMYEDTPEELVNDLMQEKVWEGMPLGLPILGTQNTIKNFDSKILKSFYNTYYTPSNTIISVVGNFEFEQIFYQIEKYFGDWQSKPIKFTSIPKSIYKPVNIIKDKDIEQTHICLAFQGLNVLSDDIFILDVFNTIFGDSTSSRLFQSIREDKGLAYCVYSDIYTYIDDGIFTIYASMSPYQSKNVLDIIDKEIYKIKNTPISQLEVEKAKEHIKSNYLIGLEDTNNLMSTLGRDMLLLNNIKTTEYIINKIDSITAQQILDISNKILDISKMSTVIINPAN